jgi:hypothetical protein
MSMSMSMAPWTRCGNGGSGRRRRSRARGSGTSGGSACTCTRAREQQAEAIESPGASDREKNIERDAGEKKQQQQHGYGPEAHPGEAAALLGGVVVHGRREGAALRRSGEEQSRSGQVRSGREEERLPRPRSWGRGGGGRVFL